jgi:hypothetical protein
MGADFVQPARQFRDEPGDIMTLDEALLKHKKLLKNRWTFQIRDGWKNVDEIDIELNEMDARGNASISSVGGRTYGSIGDLWSSLIDEAVALKNDVTDPSNG